MSPTFTDDDIGKRVESAEGETLGVVGDVTRETAYVEPAAPEADVSADATGGADAVPVGDDAVERITDEAIRLGANFPVESIDPGEEVPEAADASDGRPGERGVPGSPGESVDPPGSEPETDLEETERETGPGGVGEPGPGTDELDEELGGGELTDATAEIDGDAERGSSDAADPLDEVGGPDEADASAGEGRRELDVDPDDLIDGDPETEIRPEEDVGNRTDEGD